MTEDAAVVLFDGTCNLCNGSVQFLLDHERGHDLRFAALQSDAAEKLLASRLSPAETELLRKGTDGTGSPDSLVIVEGNKVYLRSAGALRIARHLRLPWRWLRVFVIVPRPLRDLVYRWIAKNRYRWFGTTETCRVPTPELRARFLQ